MKRNDSHPGVLSIYNIRTHKEMLSRGCTHDNICYFSLMRYLCVGGDFDATLEVCKESMKRDWVPCFKTMKMLVSKSKVEEAREIIKKVKKFSSKADMRKEVEEGLTR